MNLATQPALTSRRSALRAFTIIELLVVITIISILVAIMLPALASARMAAQSTQCLANQRGIGLAGAMYHADNKDEFPTLFNLNPPPINASGPTVAVDFPPYAIRYYLTDRTFTTTLSGTNSTYSFSATGAEPKSMICPSLDDVPSIYGPKWRISYGFHSDYRGGWARKPGLSRKRVSEVASAAAKVYAMDWGGSWLRTDRFNSSSSTSYSGALVPGAGAFGFLTTGAWANDWASDLNRGRHNLRVNVLYVDGHAATQESEVMINLWHYAGFSSSLLYDRGNHPFSIGGR